MLRLYDGWYWYVNFRLCSEDVVSAVPCSDKGHDYSKPPEEVELAEMLCEYHPWASSKVCQNWW